MGYTVRYGPAIKVRRERRRFRLRLPAMALALILSILCLRHAWPNESQRLRQALFPWTRESVRAAFAVFREDLEAGRSVSAAITAFCLEIVDEADSFQ